MLMKLIVVGLIFLSCIFLFGTIDLAVSQGTFRGKVIDAEYTGIIWKNYVFHIQRTYNETFPFTICHDVTDSEGMFLKVQDAQRQGKEVIVSYQDRFMYWNWECNGYSTPAISVEIAD